ncbi:MAG: bifunctional nicotinamide-nucleotide adenylyltransferase/Nudix hydroxylase [Gloeomargaritaceae cyanobacterium C42_A2020_066]|nr:bifunctional nicotinamide-nucleotide adenylyltransferase/Nudix hydroxylase [Gloeomargaritaceae cyanobacterium C42_A2020_066]
MPQAKPRPSGRPAPVLSVFIGRFQPFHLGHLHVVETGLASTRHVLVLVGSAGQARSHRNPFTFAERATMIQRALGRPERVHIEPLLDHPYNDAQWMQDVQATVAATLKRLGHGEDAPVALLGHCKDHTSYYLKLFPQWQGIEAQNIGNLSATPMREALFADPVAWLYTQASHALPAEVHAFLTEFVGSPSYRALAEEYAFIHRYRQQWAASPYPPTFVTVDACVVQSGHILLVKRRSQPGEGLWALPGGFLHGQERIEDSMIRELREETRLKVPDPVLRGSIVTQRVFDDPHRSARGRTVTHAFLIHLKPDLKLPEVKAASDAREARWWPLAEICPDQMFEDHAAIIENLVALI